MILLTPFPEWNSENMFLSKWKFSRCCFMTSIVSRVWILFWQIGQHSMKYLTQDITFLHWFFTLSRRIRSADVSINKINVVKTFISLFGYWEIVKWSSVRDLNSGWGVEWIYAWSNVFFRLIVVTNLLIGHTKVEDVQNIKLIKKFWIHRG